MMHEPTLVVEIRELPPEDGWACYEATGRACLVCCCGTNTGFTDKAEALRALKDHPARPQPQPELGDAPRGLRARLTGAVSDVLDEHPEHNTQDEHAAAVSEVVAAVLPVICKPLGVPYSDYYQGTRALPVVPGASAYQPHIHDPA